MNLRQWTPPVILDFLKRRKAETRAFRTYEEALAGCGTGYEGDELARVVVEKTKRYRDSLVSGPPVISDLRSASLVTAIGLSAAAGHINCLDFGGAAGAHYFLAKHLFGKSMRISWHVVETASMVSAARGLADGDLHFFKSIDEAVQAFNQNSIDLVFTSGALQYVPQPENTLKELVDVGAANIFVTRVGLSEGRAEKVVAVQRSSLAGNGPGALPPGFVDKHLLYPVSFCTKLDFERTIETKYQIDIRFLEERGAYIVGRKPIDMFGFFGRRASA